eukprot:scaffold3810_cov120-Isochrysis_galbana.AAC.10
MGEGRGSDRTAKGQSVFRRVAANAEAHGAGRKLCTTTATRVGGGEGIHSGQEASHSHSRVEELYLTSGLSLFVALACEAGTRGTSARVLECGRVQHVVGVGQMTLAARREPTATSKRLDISPRRAHGRRT